MGVLDNFLTQARGYDPKKDSKVAKPKPKPGFTPAEPGAMSVKPQTYVPSAPAGMGPERVDTSKLGSNLPNRAQLQNDPFGFRKPVTAPTMTAPAAPAPGPVPTRTSPRQMPTSAPGVSGAAIFAPQQKNANQLATETSRTTSPASPAKPSAWGGESWTEPGKTGQIGFDDFGIMDRIKRSLVSTGGLTDADRAGLATRYEQQNQKAAASPYMDAVGATGYVGNMRPTPTVPVPGINLGQPGPMRPQDLSFTPQSNTQNLGTITVGGVTRQVNTNPLGDLTTVDPAGKVNRVKEAGYIRNADQPKPAGTSPLPGGVQQALGLPGGDYTGALNAETAMLAAASQPGAGASFGGQQSLPAGGVKTGDSYFRGLEMERTNILNRIDSFQKGNYSPSTYGSLKPIEIAKMVAADQERLKNIDTALTGRSELANEIVKAIIGANSASTATQGDIVKQGIATQGTKYAADRDADATLAASNTKTAEASTVKQNENAMKSITDEMGILQKRMVDAPNDPSLREKFDKLAAELARLRGGGAPTLRLEIAD